MDLQKLNEKRKQIAEQREELKKQLQNNGKEVVLFAIAPFFEKCPNVEAIRWTAYTPYFNDGDACVFSSQHDSPQVKDDKCTDENDEEGTGFRKLYTYSDPSDKKLAKKIHDCLGSFTDDDMEDIFGDHVEVIVFRDRIETEEYSHD